MRYQYLDYVVCSAVWAKTTFRAEIFAEQVFAELIFTILAINRENKFREAYEILNKRKNLMIFELKKSDFIKPSVNKKNEQI